MSEAQPRISDVQSSRKTFGVKKVYTKCKCGMPIMVRPKKSPHETNSGDQDHVNVVLSVLSNTEDRMKGRIAAKKGTTHALLKDQL